MATSNLSQIVTAQVGFVSSESVDLPCLHLNRMPPKRKHSNDTPAIRTFSYSASQSTPDVEERVQRHVIVRASHDARGRVTTQIEHSFREDNVPDLTELLGELDNDEPFPSTEDFHGVPEDAAFDPDPMVAESQNQVPGPDDDDEARKSVCSSPVFRSSI